jgi:hypothetical protein
LAETRSKERDSSPISSGALGAARLQAGLSRAARRAAVELGERNSRRSRLNDDDGWPGRPETTGGGAPRDGHHQQRAAGALGLVADDAEDDDEPDGGGHGGRHQGGGEGRADVLT